MSNMWWPPNTVGGLLNKFLFLLLSSLTVFNFLMATFTGAGYLELGWKPKDENDTKFLQYCSVCEGYKAPRSHHCRKCNRCVKKMDHHCPWINNCVGWANHAYFTSFLAFAVIGSIQASIILVGSFYRGIHRQWYLYHGQFQLATVHFGLWSLILCIFSLGLAIGVVIAVGMLLYFQIRAIMRNRTGIEDWILEKANYRREGTSEKFVYPYDLGVKENIFQVLSLTCTPIGDGITWKVRDDCDQYTLTCEQIAQKAEKRARTRVYKIIRPATGSYIPLFSQGFKVCLTPPCTDEPRIKLEVGDTVRVTRWRKHWLFGERESPSSVAINNENTTSKSKSNSISPKRLPRGWFPRRCAVELVQPDDDRGTIPYNEDEEISGSYDQHQESDEHNHVDCQEEKKTK